MKTGVIGCYAVFFIQNPLDPGDHENMPQHDGARESGTISPDEKLHALSSQKKRDGG